MFDFKGKNQHHFGLVEPSDDAEIEVQHVQKETRSSFWKVFWLESFKLVRDIFLIIAIFVLAAVFVVQPVVVEGTSMVPMLHDGERLLVNKLIYYKFKDYTWGHIERGDIVVFWFPNNPNKSYVKRVIGLPGETVEVVNGKVIIDGQELDESYIQADHNQTLASFPPRRVEPHYYFVMGDNRDNSSDSRYWGLVPEKYVYGKAFFRYWKLNSVGFLEHGEYQNTDLPKTERVAPEEEESSE